MTTRHELRCLQITFVLRMYCILNKAIEDLSTFRIGTDSRGDQVAAFVPNAGPEPYRPDLHPVIVCLTEKASWAGTDAFEVRWTSLAA